MTWIKKYLLLGFSSSQIKDVRDDLNRDNLLIAKNIIYLLIVLLFGMLLFYQLLDNLAIRNIICSFGILSLVILLIIIDQTLKSNVITTIKTDLLILTLTWLCFSTSIYLGTFASPDALAVAPIWMFFFIILVFNQLPQSNLITILVAFFLFAYCSYLTKDTYNFQYDCLHGATSLLASLYMSWVKSKIKIENLISLHNVRSSHNAAIMSYYEQEKEVVELRQRVDYDELTGFYNKDTFRKKVRSIIQDHSHEQHVLICSDLNHFKQINDSFGHLFGDKTLKGTADMIRSIMGPQCLLGRFGGDEFVMFFSGVTALEDIEKKIELLSKESHKTYDNGKTKQHISLALGYSTYPHDGTTYAELFEIADERVYDNKNRYR